MIIPKNRSQYLSNLQDKLSKNNLGWRAGHTSLMDLPDEELACMFGNCVLKWDSEELVENRENAIVFDDQEELPRYFDWRNVNGKNYVTPVKDQKQCGSCVAFATIASIESCLRIAYGCPVGKSALPTLSEANAYYCHGGDCNGVTLSTVLRNVISAGVVPEKNMNYFTIKQGTKIKCYSDCAHKRGTKDCKITGSNPDSLITRLYSYNSIYKIDNMKRAIVKYGPIVAAYSSGASIIAYQDGVYKPLEDEEVFSDHAVCFIGYNDDKRCFIYKNSWGKRWGNNGFGELSYDAPIYSYAYIPAAFSRVYSNDGELYNDVMMRDNFDDFGQSRVSGNLCSSPDIIPSNRPIDNYQTVLRDNWYKAFGQNMKTGANYIYTRSRNLSKGSLSYKIHLYYCESSLLMYPRQWRDNVIHTMSAKECAVVNSVQFGEGVITPEPFVWQPPQIEKGKHYCLIARAETPDHPNPVPDIKKNDDFAEFIAKNPAYAWRNVSLVDSDVSEHSEVFLYEQGSKAGKTYFVIEGTGEAPEGAYCTLHYEDGQTFIDCKGTIKKEGQVIGTLVTMPAGFKGNLVFTYKSDQFSKKRDWTLAIRAIYVPEQNREDLYGDNCARVREVPSEGIEPQKGIVVGEYIIRGVQ